MRRLWQSRWKHFRRNRLSIESCRFEPRTSLKTKTKLHWWQKLELKETLLMKNLTLSLWTQKLNKENWCENMKKSIKGHFIFESLFYDNINDPCNEKVLRVGRKYIFLSYALSLFLFSYSFSLFRSFIPFFLILTLSFSLLDHLHTQAICKIRNCSFATCSQVIQSTFWAPTKEKSIFLEFFSFFFSKSSHFSALSRQSN